MLSANQAGCQDVAITSQTLSNITQHHLVLPCVRHVQGLSASWSTTSADCISTSVSNVSRQCLSSLEQAV